MAACSQAKNAFLTLFSPSERILDQADAASFQHSYGQSSTSLIRLEVQAGLSACRTP